MKREGYKVEECTAAEGAEFPARRALKALQDTIGREDRFVVIEDGGYITPLLHEDEFASLRDQCIGVVEQTTKGLRSVKAVDQSRGLRLPIVAVAESDLKLRLEAAEVGEALAFTLESYFRQTLDTHLHRVPTLVIGYGAVGRPLAEALASRGAKVTVFDLDPNRQIEASVNKLVDTVDSLDDLSQYRLVVGTTGTTSLKSDLLSAASDGIILASGSSDRLEFDLTGLIQQVAQPLDANVIQQDLRTTYNLRNGRSVSLLCDGYPINFIIGDGIAKSVIDPILTELVAGAVLLATGIIQGPGIKRLPKELEQELWHLYRTLHP